MEFSTPKQLFDRVSELRRNHGTERALIAMLCAQGLAYVAGKQWNRVSHNVDSGETNYDEWDENYNPRAGDLRVVDNRIGPLYRRVAASTDASRVEASVKPQTHHRDMKWARVAASSELALNGIDDMAGFTRAYRKASSLRWSAGSSLLILRKMRRHLDSMDDDYWLRWEHAPITDLIWDVSNRSPDLRDHQELILEQPMTVTKFEHMFGDIEQFEGVDRDKLPKMRNLAQHYIGVAEFVGSGIFDSYQAMSDSPAVRLLTYFKTDESDPNKWSRMYHIIDLSTGSTTQGDIRGVVINWDDPTNEYGHNGLPIIKLDAFRRDDGVYAIGLPHAMSSQQDLLNTTRTLSFQQMLSFITGQWLVDVSTVDSVDEFSNKLAESIGGVLPWNSRGGQNNNTPQAVRPPASDPNLNNVIAELAMAMQDQAHISPIQKGIGKSHVPHSTSEMLLRESAVVVDRVIARDVDDLSDLMATTLGTLRGTLESGISMLTRLQDRAGFSESDLMSLSELDPRNIALLVRVRENSIIVKSIDEQIAELDKALQLGQLTPIQHAVAMYDQLQRPITKAYQNQIDFCRNVVRMIMNGLEWPGLPSLNAQIFTTVVQDAIYGLDIENPDMMETAALLEQAIQTQVQLAEENPAFQSPMTPPSEGTIPNGTGQAAQPEAATALPPSFS